MNRLRPRSFRRAHDTLRIEIAFRRRRGAEPDRLVRLRHMAGPAVRVGIDGDGAHAQSSAGSNDAAGDLAAIGDQKGANHVGTYIR